MDSLSVGKRCIQAAAILIVGTFFYAVILRYVRTSISPNNISTRSSIVVISAALVCVLYRILYMLFESEPILWVVTFLLSNDSTRLLLCLYWIFAITITLFFTTQSYCELMTRVTRRKIFHFLVLFMFTPPTLYTHSNSQTLYNPETKTFGLTSGTSTNIFTDTPLIPFMTLSFGVALSVLFVIEGLRHSPLGKEVPLKEISDYFALFLHPEEERSHAAAHAQFLPPMPFTVLIPPHISLLVACALPVFLWHIATLVNAPGAPMLTLTERNMHATANILSLPAVIRLLPHVGVVTVGVGDAVAAIMGQSLGVTCWRGTRKTVEGSIAAFVAMAVSFIFIWSLMPQSSNFDGQCYAISHDCISTKWDVVTISTILAVCATAALVEVHSVLSDNLTMPLVGVCTLLTSPAVVLLLMRFTF